MTKAPKNTKKTTAKKIKKSKSNERLVSKTALESILDLLKEKNRGVPKREVIDSLFSYRRGTVERALLKLQAAQKIHVPEWDPRKCSTGQIQDQPVYMLGQGENVPSPQSVERKKKLQASEQRREIERKAKIKLEKEKEKEDLLFRPVLQSQGRVATSVFDYWQTI